MFANAWYTRTSGVERIASISFYAESSYSADYERTVEKECVSKCDRITDTEVDDPLKKWTTVLV